MRYASIVALSITVACRARPAHEPQQIRLDATAVDSIVLERGPCFGTCPAYRLSIASSGSVHFRSAVPRDPSTATDSISPSSFADLVRRAERVGFTAFPSSIRDDPDVCGPALTDFPSAKISVFAGDHTVIVDDYLACHGPAAMPAVARRLRLLRGFEDAIDSVARAGRWIR